MLQRTICPTGSQIEGEGRNLLPHSSMAYLALSLLRKNVGSMIGYWRVHISIFVKDDVKYEK